ncbi:MAG: 2-oxoglutarate dehydrogenase complex dihydrolipoyllysine-residue succinyltransferase [Henriciella sp.]
MIEITVPVLGESVTEATVGRWLKQPGEKVAKDDVLVELETDKVAVEVSAAEDGVLADITAQEGDNVVIGALLGKLSGGGESAVEASPQAPPAQPVADTAAASANGQLVDVVVPSMGESVAEGTIASFSKQVGENISLDETIAEIETDKVALEVPASATGQIAEWLVAEGDAVVPGAVIARIAEGAVASAAPAKAAPAKAPQTQTSAAAPAAPAPAVGSDRPVVPSVRRIAAEAGIPASSIPGTGRDGRATKADALSFVEKTKMTKAIPTRDTGPREERVTMTRLRQTIAKRLKSAQETAAMLTTFNDVDMTAVMALRKKYKDSFFEKHGVKMGFMGFFTKAVVSALQEIPAVNSEIDGNDIIYKNHYDIGVAVGTERGLVVPVIRDCDELSIAGVEREIGEMGKKARDGNLSISDMQGGTFTISNGGVYGSLMSTPILNPPQSGVLGMHRIEQRPVAINGEVKIRPMMYLALSYDHRIVDGKEAVTFLVRVKEALEAPERLLLEV